MEVTTTTKRTKLERICLETVSICDLCLVYQTLIWVVVPGGGVTQALRINHLIPFKTKYKTRLL